MNYGRFLSDGSMTGSWERVHSPALGRSVARSGIKPVEGSALDIRQSPRLVSQCLLARSARLVRYAVPYRERNSRWGPHNGLRRTATLPCAEAFSDHVNR